MDIIRFITAGSVDDGKSTLIGRLLYDTSSVYRDQLNAIEQITKSGSLPDLSLLTDGLRSEREQGITIDIAYRYFQTKKRKFIIADAPGHIQYTRNMITGASNCNAALILVDARKGVLEQTRRHYYICHLLGIQHIFVCVNKMDLVNYNQLVFEEIRSDFINVTENLKTKTLSFFPIAAISGENIVSMSDKMKWYEGNTLLTALEGIEVERDRNYEAKRFFVQYILRAKNNDYRAYAGQIEAGVFHKGDEVKLYPSKESATISSIESQFEKQVKQALPGMSVALRLNKDIDISRGELIVDHAHNLPKFSKEPKAVLCWMDTKTAKENIKYILQIGTMRTRVTISCIHSKINISTYQEVKEQKEIQLNDIARVTFRAASEVPFDSYIENTSAGRGILIDEITNSTVGACMFTEFETEP